MGPKTILICPTTPENSETLLKVAVPLARKHSAHLTCLRIIDAMQVHPGIALHLPDDVFAAFAAKQQQETEALSRVLEKYTANEDFVSEFRIVKVGIMPMGDRMVESARAADLVFLAQQDAEHDHHDQQTTQIQVIRECGRPVIVVPTGYDGPDIGANILLGWSDTREAARAAHDMLAVADEGAKLTVLRVGPAPTDELKDGDAIDIAEMFARHGLVPTLEHREPQGRGIAEILGKVAFEKGADLIATGAFGHSRVYDFVLGATSYALLRDQKLPVLFSK